MIVRRSAVELKSYGWAFLEKRIVQAVVHDRKAFVRSLSKKTPLAMIDESGIARGNAVRKLRNCLPLVGVAQNAPITTMSATLRQTTYFSIELGISRICASENGERLRRQTAGAWWV